MRFFPTPKNNPAPAVALPASGLETRRDLLGNWSGMIIKRSCLYVFGRVAFVYCLSVCEMVSEIVSAIEITRFFGRKNQLI